MAQYAITYARGQPIIGNSCVTGLLGTVQDISDRKRVEEALKESEGKFREIFNNVNDAIEIIELKDNGTPGRFIDINMVACRMVLYTSEELLGGSPIDINTGYYSRPLDEIFGELQIKGNSIFETEHRRKDGRIVPVEINTHVITLQGKKVLLSVVRDITDRKKAENALRQANRVLKLLSGITRHDILNKVSIILGYLAYAEKKFPDPELADYFRKMGSATKAIRSQIEFTKVYQDLGTDEHQWQDLGMLLLRLHTPETITVRSDVSGIGVFTDPMLERVFFNILDNSIRHGEGVTEIRVSSSQLGDDLLIIWEDNGVGIPADEKEKIFERGFGKNTGLGMFLVREILLLTGITIKETGVPGRGARFEITVPKGMYRYAKSQ